MKKSYQTPEVLLIKTSLQYMIATSTPTPPDSTRNYQQGGDAPDSPSSNIGETSETENGLGGQGQGGYGTTRSKGWDFIGGAWDD